MIPAPSHLKDCTVSLPDRADEFQYAGHVKCTCGSEAFKALHTADTNENDGEIGPCTTEIDGEFYFRIVAKCVECDRDHVLLDMDFHGWNGFVGRGDDSLRPRPPLTDWTCRSCGQESFQIDVVVSGEDMETAIDESDGILDESNWQEGFGWIDIRLHCENCNDDHESWVSYETM